MQPSICGRCAGAYGPGASAGIAPRVEALAPGRALREAPDLAASPVAALGLEERLALVALQPGVLPPGAAVQPPGALDYTLGAMALGALAGSSARCSE